MYYKTRLRVERYVKEPYQVQRMSLVIQDRA
jgi:hypothetical protein